MKEKALSQENLECLMDGMNSTKLESIRQLYLNVRSQAISEDHGLMMCRSLIQIVSELACPMNLTKDSVELWIRLQHGPEVLKGHRDASTTY